MEWLETDGAGGFASGTADLVRTRRYHALLLSATKPPSGRFALVHGVEAWLSTPAGRFALSTQQYSGDVRYPDGASRIAAFDPDPWPRWTFHVEEGSEITHEIFVARAKGATVLTWRAARRRAGVRLEVRPLFSGRDYHSLHHENPAFRFEPERRGGSWTWRPYDGVPSVTIASTGEYAHDPVWYRDFFYIEESERGLDCREDLASPGVFRFDLSRGEAVLVLRPDESVEARGDALAGARAMRSSESRRRRKFPSRLERAADDYLVRRGSGGTIVAGYPWFTDWGRDTFIALRGLCLSTRRLREAREILLEWSGAVSEGMLPNRFPDSGETPEYNSVDASLWYVVAVHEYLAAAERRGARVHERDRRRLLDAVEKILQGYTSGTRFGIRADDDGLLAAGEPGVQLTWMDAKDGDRVVTPRIGKPVEVQALWANALEIHARRSGSAQSKERASLAAASFERKFWREEAGSLFDVVDCDHVPGTADASFRPNQIFAVGGLPFPLLSGERARRVVDAVEARLVTPVGLRSLAPGEPGYVGRYVGGVRERDAAYHQGTVWPWLLGPFVEAWVRVRGRSRSTLAEARARFLDPLLARSKEAGLGHLPEIFDGDSPHPPRGCPFQAWSVGEALRLDLEMLAPIESDGPSWPESKLEGRRWNVEG
ncbi:MAG TPA: amylo-alpha-1,6-glucosidase [Thermoanaerobaculia bacterium]